MKKAKRHLNGFINHLFGVYAVPRIPVIIHWGYDVVQTPTGVGFGVYSENTDGSEPAIHIAAGKLGTRIAMQVIAHEFCHYLQHLKGRSWDDVNIETDADYWSEALVNQYIINKKSKNVRIDGVAPIWEGANQ